MSENNNTKKINVDEQVLNLWNKVKTKQKEISKVERPSWLTTCSISKNPDNVNDRFNIQTVTDLNKLIDIYGFLLITEEKWEQANKELGLKVPFKWMNYSGDKWKKDIQSRISVLSLYNKKKELEVLQERLDKLITTEQRRELELEEISKLELLTD